MAVTVTGNGAEGGRDTEVMVNYVWGKKNERLETDGIILIKRLR